MTDNLIVSHNAPFYFIQNPGHIRRKHMFKKKLANFCAGISIINWYGYICICRY